MTTASFVSTKLFRGFPCTHRQWKAGSHCRYVHGYSRDFYFEFACSRLTKERWVVDFGGLARVREWLDHMFDHTFLVARDDPEMDLFKDMDRRGVVQLRVLDDTSMEATAEFVCGEVGGIVREVTDGRAWIVKVEVRENEKNSGIYIPPAGGA